MPLFSRLPRSASSDRVSPHNHNVIHTLKRVVSSSGISMAAQGQGHSHGQEPTGDRDDDLLALVRENNITAVMRSLSRQGRSTTRLNFLGSPKAKRCNINHQLPNGMSALHQAAFNGAVPMMHVLLDHGAKVDLRDSRGLSPLHVACFQGHFESVQLLLKWHSDVNLKAHNGLTPMHLASQNGHYDVVKLLLFNNADVMSRTEDGRTSFDVACEYGRFSIVQLLISMRADYGLNNLESNSESQRIKFSCLHLAARNGHIDVLRLLLSQSGVNVNRVCELGTCLHLAASFGHLGVAKLLLEYGVDPTIVNSFGQTAKDIINRNTPHSRELNQLLSERLSALEAVAIKDFCDLADAKSIAFRAGEHITVLEQGSAMWKGYVTREGMARTGYFPAATVQIKPVSHSSECVHSESGLVPCAIPHLDCTDYVGNNRNSSASVDSGRGSAHTVASSESGASRILPTIGNHSSNNSAPRTSVVSTCSSGSLGSLQDDTGSQGSADVSSPESTTNYNPCDWLGMTPAQQLLMFLNTAQFGIYYKNFEEAGYDLPTMTRMTPEDLNAVGLTNPKHRKRLRLELTKLAHAFNSVPNWEDPLLQVEAMDCEEPVSAFTRSLQLPQNYECQLESQGFCCVRDLRDLSWEDLEEIGISKLGHQKKLILAVERLRRRENGSSPATLRRTPTMANSSVTTAIIHPLAAESVPDSLPSPSKTKPIAKITGRPVVVSPPLPPEPLKMKPKVPPPPPKRSTSVKLSQSPCASPKRLPAPAYENVSLIENAIMELGSAQARHGHLRPQKPEPIPFANENCGTIRHKPPGLETVPESRSPTPNRAYMARPRMPQCQPNDFPCPPQFQSSDLPPAPTDQYRPPVYQAHQLPPPIQYSSASDMPKLSAPKYQANGQPPVKPQAPVVDYSNLNTNTVTATPPNSTYPPSPESNRVKQLQLTERPRTPKRDSSDSPRTPQHIKRESCISNLDDICEMLTDLQSILDKELQEHS